MTSARAHVSDDERRARLVRRHLLAPGLRADAVEDVAAALVALHATDPATVYLAVRARMAAPTVAEVERALYDERTLHRMMAMRRTMFVVPDHLAHLVHESAGRAIAARERKGGQKFLQDELGWTAERYAETETAVLAALRERGEATAAELGEAVPEIAERIVVARGKRYESSQAASARLLRTLAAERRILRGRPRGSWTSAQFRWSAAPEGEDAPRLDEAAARAELARHYLARFGPATLEDVKWWTGWTVTATRRAIADAGAREADLDTGTGYLLAGDDAEEAETDPAAALLPALDPTAMGWRGRDFYLDPDHVPALFDRNGNIGPTVWWNGRVVGAWAVRKDGEVVWRALTDIGGQGRSAVEAEAARLAQWLGDTRVTPSFGTPLERELAAG
ncbi:winged helix DNA-binding protein [Nocardiopsis sp. Huas11]|uniref:winged helix DNA-binding domain-containing protein n=1 Tax=Nocardiopsis sp. Huas11 TaxID=2183912 RepID=UPI000EB5520D|nr:winged helix DNA-binding domain-containing protein [Nocardiopsis sp. Huas11]RKS09914.1 winged helix DNA-binding protein [Nocardiopsis sp. Huas11]